MRRPALYSSSRSGRVPEAPPAADTVPAALPTGLARPSRFSASSPRMLWTAILVLATLLAVSIALSLRPGQRRLTQEDINAAVMKTIETQVMPSEYARAYDKISPSVVRVISYVKKSRLKKEEPVKNARLMPRPKPLGPAQPGPDQPGGGPPQFGGGGGRGA